MGVYDIFFRGIFRTAVSDRLLPWCRTEEQSSSLSCRQEMGRLTIPWDLTLGAYPASHVRFLASPFVETDLHSEIIPGKSVAMSVLVICYGIC